MKQNYTLENDGITNGNGNELVAVKILPNYTRYIIYSDGRIYNRETDAWMNQNRNKTNYATITMKSDSNEKNNTSIHRLIYKTFIGDIPKGYQINHKDENRRNNVILFDKQGNIAYSNLELVTAKENCNHGTRNKRISTNTNGKKKPKQSFIVKVNNDVVQEFKTITELVTAHPSQNRLTWRYRLYDIKKPQKSYFTWQNGNLLEITPTSEEYKTRLETEGDLN